MNNTQILLIVAVVLVAFVLLSRKESFTERTKDMKARIIHKSRLGQLGGGVGAVSIKEPCTRAGFGAFWKDCAKPMYKKYDCVQITNNGDGTWTGIPC